MQQISQTDFGESVVSLWYIGQMGVIVKWRGMVLCIDPVLGAMPGADGRDRRSYPARSGRGNSRRISSFAPTTMRTICTPKHLPVWRRQTRG